MVGQNFGFKEIQQKTDANLRDANRSFLSSKVDEILPFKVKILTFPRRFVSTDYGFYNVNQCIKKHNLMPNWTFAH